MGASKYHFYRYSRSRTFSKEMLKYWTEYVGASCFPTNTNFQDVCDLIITHYNEDLMALPFEQRPSDMGLIMKEVDLAILYNSFCAHGRNIFDFNQPMIEMFDQTDIDDIPVSLIKLPYSVFHISFPPSDELKIKGDMVDGAYILNQKTDDINFLTIHLTTTPKSPDITQNYILNPDQGFRLTINIGEDGKTISEAVNEAYNERYKEVGGFLDVFSEDDRIGTSSATRRAKRDRNDLSAGLTTFRFTLRRVINSILYLSAYPEENELLYPDDAPKSLVSKAENAQSIKEKRRAASKLIPLGFTKIYFCHQRAPEDNRTHADTGKKKQHWRRGHWRNQAYGKGMAERRLKWIMPTMINKEDKNIIKGHIYSVK